MMEQWEYKTLKIKTGGFLGGKVDEQEFEEELNRLDWTDGSWYPASIRVSRANPGT